LFFLSLNIKINTSSIDQPGSSSDLAPVQAVELNQNRVTSNSCGQGLALVLQRVGHVPDWCTAVKGWQRKMPRFTALVGEIRDRVVIWRRRDVATNQEGNVLFQEDFYRRLLALAPQEMEDSSVWCRDGRDSKAALVAAWQEKMPRFTALVGEIERRVTAEIENIRASEMRQDADEEPTIHDPDEESGYNSVLKGLRDIGATADVRVLEFSQDRCVLGFKDRIRILIAQSLVRLEIQWQESSVFRSSRFCIDDTLEGTRLSIPPVHFGFDGCSIEIPDRILNGVTDLIFEEISKIVKFKLFY